MLVTGDSAGVVMMTAVAPMDRKAKREAPFKAALLSVDLLPNLVDDIFEGFPLTMEVPNGFPDRQRIGPAILLADGVGSGLPPDRPMMVVSSGWPGLGADL